MFSTNQFGTGRNNQNSDLSKTARGNRILIRIKPFQPCLDELRLQRFNSRNVRNLIHSYLKSIQSKSYNTYETGPN
jgi:hypothetical protein